MIQGMYSVKDDLSGEHQYFGVFVNDAVAKRTFCNAVLQDGVPASDLSLYRIGDFDTNSSNIVLSDMEHSVVYPAFICRGKKDEV